MDKEKLEKIKPIKHERYKNVDLDHLVMYGIGILEKSHLDLSFENAVVAAYKLFPNKFALQGYPAYPDAKRIHDCLFRCTFKTKQWLGGKTRQGYIITERSRRFITESENLLKTPAGTTLKKQTAHSQTRRKEVLLREVYDSSAYKKYATGNGDHISESEICYLLQGTLDSAREMLKKNLLTLKQFAEELNNSDIVTFLDWLHQHFHQFFESYS